MNLATLALALLLQTPAQPQAPSGPPGRTTARAGDESFVFEGGGFTMSERSLSIAGGPGVPGVRFNFGSSDGKTWSPVGADQSVWLTGQRGGQVKNPAVVINSTADNRLTATWTAMLTEQREGGPVEVPLSGTFDLPNRGRALNAPGPSVAKGGIALLGIVISLAALGGLLIGGVWIAIAGFKESPLWGWLTLPAAGPIVFVFLYWGVGSGSLMVFGGLVSIVGIVGAVAFSMRHWDIARVPFIMYTVCLIAFGIFVVALIVGQEKRPERQEKGPKFYENQKPTNT